MCRWAFRLAVFTAVGLAGWAAYSALSTTAEQPALIDEDPVHELATRPTGTGPVTFRIANHSNRPARIIGLNEG